MLSTILHGVDQLAPKLICFLPLDAVRGTKADERWWRKAFSPRDWLNERVLIFFFDPIRLRLAPTNPDDNGVGQGFEVAFPKAWVAKAMPYVQLGLTTVKILAATGRLAGFPVPDVTAVLGGWIDEQLGEVEALKDNAVAWLAKQTADEGLATELLGKVDACAQQMVAAGLEGAAPVEGSPFDERMQAPLERSIKELDALLPPDWKERCGLVLATSRASGKSEWVLKEDKERFEEDGAALLAKESSPEPKEAMKEARDQLARRQQQIKTAERKQQPARTAEREQQPAPPVVGSSVREEVGGRAGGVSREEMEGMLEAKLEAQRNAQRKEMEAQRKQMEGRLEAMMEAQLEAQRKQMASEMASEMATQIGGAVKAIDKKASGEAGGSTACTVM